MSNIIGTEIQIDDEIVDGIITNSVSDGEILWRYLDLDKFLYLIVNKNLYFCSASQFEDEYEMLCDINSVLNVDNKEIIQEVFYSYSCKENNSNVIEESEEMKKWLASLFCERQDATLVSCWHLNNGQSDAMWKLYSSNEKKAVAIQTTVGNLKRIFLKRDGFMIGKVNYTDYKTFPNMYDAIWNKRNVFSHEQELRIVRVETNYGKRMLNPDGSVARSACVVHDYPINLNDLIDSVFISPYANTMFADLIRRIMYDYKLEKPLYYQDYDYKKDVNQRTNPREMAEKVREDKL